MAGKIEGEEQEEGNRAFEATNYGQEWRGRDGETTERAEKKRGRTGEIEGTNRLKDLAGERGRAPVPGESG